MQLDLVVSTVAGRRININVCEDDTVEILQNMLARDHGCPPELQVLLLRSREGRLCPGYTLRDYGLGPEDKEVLLIRDLPPRPECKPPQLPLTSVFPKGDTCPSKQQILSPKGVPCTCKPQSKRRRPPQHKAPRPLPARPTMPPPQLLPETAVPKHERRGSSPKTAPKPSSGVAAPPVPVPPQTAGASPTTPSPPSALPTEASPSKLAMRERTAGSGATVGQSPRSRRIRRADLERVGRLGVGAFGVVTLEADRRSGRTYALKAVSKGYLASLSMEYSVLNEKRILKMVDSPFVVRLLATYNGKEHVYFLLEAALGGELFTTYERLRLYGSERHARFYVACVVEALAHLHDRQVIYRDLKPENLLLDARGYCKLTDMGLAKVSPGLTFTLVGTPDYMAPEVIKQSGHGRSVDWWMLGVLLFELLAGKAPFEAPKTEQIYEQVKRGIDQVIFPPECRGMSAELVKALCRLDPGARLRVPGLRDHAWFRCLDWQALRTLRLQPPFQPRVRGPRDLSNFRQCDQEDPPAVHYVDNGSGWDIGFEDEQVPEALAPLGTQPSSRSAAAAALIAAGIGGGLGGGNAAGGSSAATGRHAAAALAARSAAAGLLSTQCCRQAAASHSPSKSATALGAAGGG